jgi:hypothetical protein
VFGVMMMEDYRIKAAAKSFTAFVARIMETPFRTKVVTPFSGRLSLR